MKKIIIISLLCLLLAITTMESIYANQNSDNNEGGISYNLDSNEIYHFDVYNMKVPHGSSVKLELKRTEVFNIFEEVELKVDADDEVDIESEKTKKIKDDYKLKFKIKDTGENVIKLKYKSSKKEGEIRVFIYSTESFDYISTVSLSAAKYVYFQEMVEDGVMTEDDLYSFVYGSDFIVYEELNYNVLSGDSIRVKGKIEFEDENGNSHPAQGIKIEIYDAEVIFDKKLETLYTNSNGDYSSTFANETAWGEDGYDIYVKVVFENGDFAIYNPFESAQQQANVAYNHKFVYFGNVPNGAEVVQDIKFTWGQYHDRTSAMHLHQAAISGFKYLDYVDGSQSWGKLSVWFPMDSSTSYYFPLTDTIVLTNARYYRWDTLLHEFGHFVDDKYNMIHPAILTEYSHSFGQDLIDDYGKSNGSKLALTEGFADFYAMASMKKFVSPLGVESLDYNSNVYNVGEDYYNKNYESYSMNFYGEGQEGAISMLLYDLIDINTEAHDGHAFNDSIIFDKLNDADGSGMADNFYDFWTELTSTYNYDFGKLLTYYGFAAKPLTPVSTSNYMSPLFAWDKQGGDGTASQNDQFELHLYNKYGTEIFTQPLGNVSSYQLSDIEWTNILQNQTDYITWNITATDIDSPSTGPYDSESLTIYLPEPINLPVNTYVSNQFINNEEIHWYEFTVPETGYYDIYSTGTLDMYGGFFFDVVAEYLTTGMFAYDNNSGSGNNFKKRLYLIAGQTIYIRVNENYLTQNTQYRIRAQFIPPC
ncbi:MAG: hypothetical protein KQ78_01329 [Candidatus Izimaplasma bacterium HR2]|nr:MAG: hypothetical protein KQ78_01329 [Candidatus Izimaplasma bacterium HR2]